MAAFAKAANLGFRFMEIDIQATRDEVPVVFHDDGLERLTGRGGSINDAAWEDLREARVHGREPIPLLEEVLGTWPDLRFIVELKSDRVVEPLAEVLTRTGALERVCVGSFDDGRIARMRRLVGPGLCTALGRRGVARLRLASLGLPVGRFAVAAAQVPVRYRGLTVVDRRMIRVARRRGIQIQVWTVNEEPEMDRLIDLGVDAIITDRPSLLKAVLIRRGLWSLQAEMAP